MRVVELEEITGSILGTHFADQIDELRVWPTWIELLPFLEATWSGHTNKTAGTKNQKNI